MSRKKKKRQGRPGPPEAAPPVPVPPPEREALQASEPEAPHESNVAEAPQTPGSAARARRWNLPLRGALRIGPVVLVLLLGFIVIAGAWISGIPFELLAESRLRNMLGADADLEGVSVGRGITVAELRLRQPGGSDTVLIRDLSLDYSLRPTDGRYLQSASIGALGLKLDSRETPASHQWAREFFNAPATEAPNTAIIPVHLGIDEITLEARSPNYDLYFTGPSIEADLGDSRHFSLAFTGPNVAVRSSSIGEAAGPVALHVSRNGDTFAARGDARVGDILGIDGHVKLVLAAGGGSADLNIRELLLRGPVWPPLLRDVLELPIAFDEVRVQDTTVLGAWGGQRIDLPQAKLNAQVANLTLGPTAAPWYAGDVVIEGAGGSSDNAIAVDARVVLGDAPPLQVRLGGTAEALSADITAPAWSRTQLQTVVPEETLALMPTVEELGGEVTLAHQDGWTVEAALRARLDEQDATLGLSGQRDEAHLFSGQVDAALGGGRAEGAVQVETAERFSGDLVLASVDPAIWWRALRGDDALAALATRASGPVELARAEDGASTAVWDLSLQPLHVGDMDLGQGEPVAFEGDVNLRDTGASGSVMIFDAGEAAEAEVRDWKFQSEASQFESVLSVDASAPYLMSLVGQTGWYGAVSAEGPMHFRDGRLRWQLRAEAPELGYGDWATPYNVPLLASGTVHFDSAEKLLGIDALSLELPEQATATLQRLRYDGSGATTLEGFLLETNLAPIVSRGFLAEGSGKLALSSEKVIVQAGTVGGEFQTTFDSDHLVVPNQLATLSTVHFEGLLSYAGGLAGTGSLTVGGIEAAGTRMSDLHTPVRGEGKSVVLEGAQTSLFGGLVNAVIRAGLLEEGWPTSVEATVTDLDLARFTAEFKPPDTELTGIVSGHVNVSFSLNGLDALDVDLNAPAGISLNRDMVEKILMSQQLGEAAGKRATKVVQKVIGQAPMRPFDSAQLTLGLENGRIAGVALLQSRQLNLTIDIKADPEAILEAIRARNEQ